MRLVFDGRDKLEKSRVKSASVKPVRGSPGQIGLIMKKRVLPLRVWSLELGLFIWKNDGDHRAYARHFCCRLLQPLQPRDLLRSGRHQRQWRCVWGEPIPSQRPAKFWRNLYTVYPGEPLERQPLDPAQPPL